MKRFAVPLFFLAFGSMLPGCPIYGDDSGCEVDADCPSDYVCDALVGSCRPNRCTSPSQCATNETCSSAGTCVAGDCSWPQVGCVDGYTCSSKTGIWECVRGSSGGQGGASSGGAGGVTGSAGSSASSNAGGAGGAGG